jgi:hypothetical protein
MFWVGGRKQLQKIKINRWATVGKGLKRIEDKEFKQILKTDAIRFRNSTIKYHENIVRNQESVMALESDTRQKLFTLKNIRSICNQVCKNVKLTEQTVSKKYEELLSICKQNEHNILKNKIDQNNHKRKSFRAHHYSNKLHNRNRSFERINRCHHEYIFMAHETSGMSSQLPGIEEEDKISTNSSKNGPNPNNILNRADPNANFKEVPNNNESHNDLLQELEDDFNLNMDNTLSEQLSRLSNNFLIQINPIKSNSNQSFEPNHSNTNNEDNQNNNIDEHQTIPEEEENNNSESNDSVIIDMISMHPSKKPLNMTGKLINFQNFNHAISHLSQFMDEASAYLPKAFIPNLNLDHFKSMIEYVEVVSTRILREMKGIDSWKSFIIEIRTNNELLHKKVIETSHI